MTTDANASTASELQPPQDGLLVIVKEDCPTCKLVVPALVDIAQSPEGLMTVTQDDPDFPARPAAVLDRDLLLSEALEVETVPTLIRFENGRETARSVGWQRAEWRDVAALAELGEALPEARPGCGSLHLDPAFAVARLRRQADSVLAARRIDTGGLEDPVEACYARGWTDGLPVVPPTPERVMRMLGGTGRAPEDLVGEIAPDYAPCTVEKVAINAVMAGCRPEYMPVVLAAVEAAARPEFNWHGLAATTYFSGPVVVVNGPITRAIDMNSGHNALGQGNRANATIGRALQLVLRNIGGARPGEIDRATLGNPGKYTFCFAENETDSPWPSLAEERGASPGASAVTLFAGEAPRGVVDQLSREPESLASSLAMALRSVAHPKLVLGFDAMVVISPEHMRVLGEANWSKDELRAAIMKHLMLPKSEIVRGAQDCAEGVPAAVEAAALPKFRPDGLWFVHAGGGAGLFSAIIGGWVSGEMGSQPVTVEVRD